MNRALKDGKLFKTGLALSDADSNVVIGGADLTGVRTRDEEIADRVREATMVADLEAAKIIEKAQTQAEELINKAQAEVENIEQEAFKQGFQKGEESGLAHIKEEMKLTLEKTSQILESVEQERKECLEDEEQRVYKIIALIAKQLINKDLKENPNVSIDFIKQGIGKLNNKAAVNILLCPELADEVNKIRDEFIDSIPGLDSISIVADGRLNTGDLILESNRERLDLKFESQLEELIKEVCEQ